MLSLLQRKAVLAFASAVIFAAGIGAGYWRYLRARAELLAELTARVQGCAVAFHVAELQELTGAPAERESPVYASVKDRLGRLRTSDERQPRISLLRYLPANGTLLPLADSAPRTDPAQPAPRTGTLPARLSPGLEGVIETGYPTAEGPRQEDGGRWVSGYALIGPHTPGRPQHLIAFDLTAHEWYRALWNTALGTAGYVWMLLLLPLAALVTTHRQLMQGEALRNLTEAMEQGHSPIMIVDLGLRIEYANAKFCRLLGYSRRELLGREWRTFHGAEARPEIFADMVTTIRAGHPWTGEWMMPRKDGTVFPLRAAITPVKNRAGEIRSFVGVFEDMTEIRQTEALLREAKERAEAGDRAKGQFLATMSHEVRTPLNGIVGFASLLLETELTPEQLEYVETIRTSSETLIQLTGDILDYARIESGRLKLEPQPCDPRECVENALDLAATLALPKGVELLHWIDDTVPAAIVADVGRLRQVIVNLVNNAVKFTPTGEVAVDVRVVASSPAPETADAEALPSARETADAGEASCTLEFSVRDTGIGIAPAHHPKIFRPFSQVDDSTTRRYGGTGLGLAICKNLVGLMNGHITFTSELGRGSRFTFTIRVPVHTPAADRVPPTPLQGRRVMLVASGGMCEELTRLVRRFGGEVMESETAASPQRSDWDLGIQDLSASAATELATSREPCVSWLPEKMVALIPVPLPGEIRAALRPYFRQLLNKPLHHDLFGGVLGASAADPPAAAMPPPPQFGLRVLIVEDNAVNQRLIQTVVSHLGCTSHLAVNGRVALEEIARSRPEVVLMDLHMPELDGLATTAQIRAGAAGEAVRGVWIVALTADARNEQRERTLAAGANDYLTKPVRPAELQAALERYLASRPTAA
ncbi:PAS domain-containing hybrid sensor histidine kinase/response regulator [Opitutus terrae]|uniref:histidine kinase n=1 Tax=Opitutus terrae (strain DSM 11246 / JCM 15787 / PB90-1) TaxID=452637 RepID=B1ZWS0_OPITP|nr:ATP-binding protein [Opitutus terrae]ACB74197.1 PAS/PAC sensor hybrid histidine kinase [Opitutus terrae PB90-1]